MHELDVFLTHRSCETTHLTSLSLSREPHKPISNAKFPTSLVFEGYSPMPCFSSSSPAVNTLSNLILLSELSEALIPPSNQSPAIVSIKSILTGALDASPRQCVVCPPTVSSRRYLYGSFTNALTANASAAHGYCTTF